ncbi:MAG: tetratricopeptide repeat protein [Pyrinomonadaceae bacterium]|nr:tetratricopeptide repeat protein [Pyrinomonadaceae bacterium]
MARYKKKRVRELQHDRFRDTAISVFDRLGNRLEGRGKAILYGMVAVILLAILVGVGLTWSRRKADEARRALGRGIAITSTPVSSTTPLDPAVTYKNEQERAQKAIEEFQKVVSKYGDPYRTEARYFIAANLLYVDREKGISELAELSKDKSNDIATLAKFALAQAKEADGKYEEAAQLYSQISQNSVIVPPETARLRLAMVYQKQGKKKEAADILFQIAEAARKAKDTDGSSLPLSAAAREASQELQKLDPDRFAQLPEEAPAAGLTF